MNRIIATLFLMLFHVHFSSAQRSSKQDDRPPLIDPVSKCQLRYYYFPNLEAYYDTQKRIYYFKEDSQWITDEEIPEGYRGYSLYNKVYVFITDYDDEIITQFINIHKKKYPYTKRGNMKMTSNNAE